MQVILGSFTIKAYVTAPKSMAVIGIVRMGMEYGLLVLNGVGQYLRVNGSQWSYLNQQEVCLAIQTARENGCRTQKNGKAPRQTVLQFDSAEDS